MRIELFEEEKSYGEWTRTSTVWRERLEAQPASGLSVAAWCNQAGAYARAIICSIMPTCRACNIEPYSYLHHVLTEMPQRPTDADIADLLPFNFQPQAASDID